MKNKVYAYLTEVENKKRRANANKVYHALVTEDMQIYFFTEDELRKAQVRALQNREDIEPIEVTYEIVEK